ncbi:MAG: RluA family pseudouridine synthase [Candidatus Yanofskybacteria bacterium]|nr:RluA family pseudouridine synthase [Candidatus Yanofskybacteria bacterium]
MKVIIVYEDDNILVLNKPAGLITHPKNINDKQDSVTGWVIEKYPELKIIGEPFIASGQEIYRAGVVHRLDKDTSGLLLVAKNNDTFFYLKKLFQDRKIKKYYLALINGRPKNPSGTITAPLGRIGLKRTTKLIGNKLIDKKDAVTEYKTLKNYKEYTLIEVKPQSGRTHQIRVHLNSIGTPVAGDKIYGFKKAQPPSNLTRLFLHAYKLEFTAPSSAKASEDKPGGKKLILETDLPDDLQKVINELE